MEPAKLTKEHMRYLQRLAKDRVVASTAEAFMRLTKMGFAESLGLILASRGRTGVTYKAGYRITPAGLAFVKGGGP